MALGVILILGLALGAASALNWTGGGPAEPIGDRPAGSGERPAARLDATGRLLVPLEGGLSVVTLPDRAITPIVPPGGSSAVTSAQWAPDGTSLAYALYHVRPDDSAATSEIYLADLSSEPRRILERDRPGSALEAPAWAPDGRALYFGYSAIENRRVITRIERLDVVSGQRAVVTEGALPAVSADGAALAFLRSDSGGDALLLSRADGSAVRPLIPAGRYSVLGAPRFSPDGGTLAVPVSGGPGQAQEPSRGHPFGMFGASVAYAHGDPWDVYLVDVAGGEPRRLTQLSEDELTVAWSPDGGLVGVYASRGLYLVDRQGRTTFALDRGGYGGIDWAP